MRDIGNGGVLADGEPVTARQRAIHEEPLSQLGINESLDGRRRDVSARDNVRDSGGIWKPDGESCICTIKHQSNDRVSRCFHTGIQVQLQFC